VLEHVFVQPLNVILHHDLAADNSGLIDAALLVIAANRSCQSRPVLRVLMQSQ
jgi:hypothetical protein